MLRGLVLGVILALCIVVQAASVFVKADSVGLLKPIIAIETWGVSSFGQTTESEGYSNRNDLLFRRFRIGAKGNPYAWFSYTFQLNLDRFGEGVYTPIKGSYKGIGVWNAYVTIKVLKKSELLNVHLGHYWAAVSREFNTSPWAVGSFDKFRSDWFLRNFVTGEGNGITNGAGLGGLKNFEKLGISYRAGVYEPTEFENAKDVGRLYTLRLMLSLGDAEQKKYSYMLLGNQWRKRKGITLAFGSSTLHGAILNDSVVLKKSTSLGVDLLVDYVGFRFDAGYYRMHRTSDYSNAFDGNEWHVRLGYSLLIWNRYLEPVISYDQYEGFGSSLLYNFVGNDKTLDVGVNCYLNKDKMKVALHYLVQGGSLSKTRDYIGLALQYRL